MTTEAERQRAWIPAHLAPNTSLRQAYEAMPRDAAHQVPWRVRVFENPQSRVALPGAIDLFGHDCVHVLLGRGLLQQDEAFVLGFTMGSCPAHRPWHVETFAFAARYLYSGAYRFGALDARIFRFGVEVGRSSGACDLSRVDFRPHLDRSIVEVRGLLGVRERVLSAAYRVAAADHR